MFSGLPFVCACVIRRKSVRPCVCSLAQAFSDRLAVDFQFYSATDARSYRLRAVRGAHRMFQRPSAGSGTPLFQRPSSWTGTPLFLRPSCGPGTPLFQRSSAGSGTPVHRQRGRFLQVPATAAVPAASLQAVPHRRVARLRRLRRPRHRLRTTLCSQGKPLRFIYYVPA